ncbi:CerR family C-terminal domain-containing protein [Pseudomonas cerasi]|nr:CerR family C-terminal domain-containing protein [Pseudomonas cerasi]
MARHRPAVEGGYQRGEETRARIINTALVVFADRGFEGASTREIAAAAGVNAPAIQYYFDSKEGVYLECVKHVIALLWEQVGDSVETAERALVGPDDDAIFIAGVLGILGAVISLIRDDPQTAAWRPFLDRHQADVGPASASIVFDEWFKGRIGRVFQELLARLMKLPVEDESIVIHSFAFFSHALAFRAQRTGILRSFGWTEIDQPGMERIRDVALIHARFTLEGLIRQRA